MKTIKDILKTDNIEQRRRIAKNLAISKDDKDALITNKSSEVGGIQTEYCYYKVNQGFEQSEELNGMLYRFLNPTNIICHFLGDKYSDKYIEMPFSSYVSNPTYEIKYIKHNPNEYLMYIGTYSSLIVKGDLYEVFDIYIQYMIDKMGSIPQEDIDAMKNQMYSAITPCTKEEYEDIINVFPLNKQ